MGGVASRRVWQKWGGGGLMTSMGGLGGMEELSSQPP